MDERKEKKKRNKRNKRADKRSPAAPAHLCDEIIGEGANVAPGVPLIKMDAGFHGDRQEL